MISGSPGVGGVTGTTFESFVTPGLFGRSTLYCALFGTWTLSSFTYPDRFAPSLILALKLSFTSFPPFAFTSSSVRVTLIVCPSTVILSAAKSFPFSVAFAPPLSPENSNTPSIVSCTSNAVASSGTFVVTLYVNSSFRFCSVSLAFPFTSFMISGSPGVGGVTGTTLESLWYFGSLLISYEALFGTCILSPVI